MYITELSQELVQRERSLSGEKQRPEQTAGQGDRHTRQNILSKGINSPKCWLQYFKGSRRLVCKARLPPLLPCSGDESAGWFLVNTAEMFLLCCPHSWCSGAESQSAALGWGNSQLSLQLSSSCGIPSGPQVWEHNSWDTSGTWGEGAQHSWTAAAIQPGGFSSSAFPFYSPFVASLTAPTQADLAEKAPMGPPSPITPLEQQLKSIPSTDVFFSLHPALKYTPASDTQELSCKADSWP